MNALSLHRELWPAHGPTSLRTVPGLAHLAEVQQVLIKCEGERPLGSFKVLGGMTAAIRALAKHVGVSTSALLSGGLSVDMRLICATDGNHGLAVAEAAVRCGTQALVYLPASTSAVRARRIAGRGARLIRIDGTYDDAVFAARESARRGEGLLIADTSERSDDEIVSDVMEGYQVLTTELRTQLREKSLDAPSHLFIQAGVGGLAAAIAQGLLEHIEGIRLIIVEPAAAPCVARALNEGRAIRVEGSLETTAEMLSCGVASTTALAILTRYAVQCVSLSEQELAQAPPILLSQGGPRTTTSGAAGLAGLLKVARSLRLRKEHALTSNSRVLLIVTEDAAQ